jgi:NADPH:quinone reductase-like Zn-dependent oxidoreductase
MYLRPLTLVNKSYNLQWWAGKISLLRHSREFAKQIKAGKLKIQIGKVFHLDEIVKAHRCIEETTAGGKIVVAAL